MKKHLTRYILYFFCFLFSLSVWGNSYKFRGMTMADGLSDLLVNVIYKDSAGFVWLGTDNGLNHFDGVNIRPYSFLNSDGQRKRVYAVTEDKEGFLWIGNDMGLWRLSRIEETPVSFFQETINFPVYSLFYDGNTLYTGTERGLYIYREGALKQVLPDKNLLSSSNKIKGILTDGLGVIWLATAKGLYSYDPESEEITLYPVDPAFINADEFRNIGRIGNTLYLGTEGAGILRFDIPSATYSHFTDVGNGIISSLSTDGEDMIYVSTDGNGIHFLSHKEETIKKSFQHDARDKESIRSNSVYSLLVDRDGIIWVGFYQSGFDYSLYQNQLFHVYAFPPYFNTKDLTVRSFFIEEDRKLIGTRDGLFYIDEKVNRFASYRIPRLRSDLILSLCRYGNYYYIGTYGGGLSLLDVNTLTLSDFHYDDSPAFQSGHIFCQKIAPDGNLWLGTSSGIFCYNKETNEVRTYNNSNAQMPEGNVYDIYFDSTGKGWICTEYGVCIYDPESRSMKSNIFPEGFPHRDKYRLVYEDSSNRIYLLPDKGNMVVTDILLSQYSRQEMPPVVHGNAYMTILQDDLGWFWLGFDDGIIRRRDDSPLYDAFSFKDGIPGQTFLNPSFKDERGIVWFGNAKGLVYVDPREVDSMRQNPYPIALGLLHNGESLSVKEKEEMSKSGKLKLKKNQNNITFHFSDLTYTDPSVSVYEYRLDGVDGEWRLLSGRNDVSYFGLPAGNYQFHVRIPGNELSESAMQLSIRPNQAPWILVFFILLFTAAAWYSYRKKNQSAIEEEKELPEEEGSRVKVNEEKYKTKRLSEEECELLYKRLQEYMEKERPYTNSELKLADLAKDMQTSSHSLSYLFNQYVEQSYYDYINVYRIEEFKKLANGPEAARYTLTAMAEMCGFNSRASFFRSFKKYTGITPNEYINSLRKEL